MSAAAQVQQAEPIFVWVGRDRNGATFALDPASQRRVLQAYPGARVWPRLSLGQQRDGDFAQLDEAVQARVLTLLMSLDEAKLATLGPILFMDPDTEAAIATWPPDRR
jgi:hypothetical protein